MPAADGMTLWTGDYLADTGHLSTTQHGAYLLILIAMWRAGGKLPNDPPRIAKIARLPLNIWTNVGPAVMELMTVDNEGFFSQKRLARELKNTLARIEKRRSSGKAGGYAKALKTHNTTLANATLLPQQNGHFATGTRTWTRTRTSKSKESKSRETATKIPKDWQLTSELRLIGQQAGLTEKELHYEAIKFKNHFLTVPDRKAFYKQWDRVWENWVIRTAERLGRSPQTINGHSANPKKFTDEQWTQHLRAFEMTNNWNPEHGPQPGRPGCLVPHQLLTPKLV